MPNPDQYGPPNDSAKKAFDAFVGTQREDLSAELRALRQEIAALRAELKPMSKLVLTGAEVVAEFKRLSNAARGAK